MRRRTLSSIEFVGSTTGEVDFIDAGYNIIAMPSICGNAGNALWVRRRRQAARSNRSAPPFRVTIDPRGSPKGYHSS